MTLTVIGDYGGCGVDRTCDMEYAAADLVHSWNTYASLPTGDNTYQQGLVEEVLTAQVPYKEGIGAGKFYSQIGVTGEPDLPVDLRQTRRDILEYHIAPGAGDRGERA